MAGGERILSASRWTDIEGTWTKTEGLVSQKESAEGYARTYMDIGMTDFILETTFRMHEGKDGGGEAKIIFSQADKNENYRVDFISGQNLCRISAGSIITYGQPCTVEKNRDYRIRVLVKKNYITIFVDDMLIWQNVQWGSSSDGKVGIGTWHSTVSFSEPRLKRFETRNCFVIMPFNGKRDLIYDYAIEPSLRSHPDFVFNYERADKILTSERITEEVDDRIRNAHLIIADITEDNVNVYYELGLAHANHKKVILLMQRTEEGVRLPFDIKDFRTHVYEFSRRGFDDLAVKLAFISSEVLKEVQESSVVQ
jgi:hypothetical protein